MKDMAWRVWGALVLGACGGTAEVGTGAGGGAGSAVCGGTAALACGANQWCDYDPSDCGGGDRQGVCRPRPQACEEIYAPVCGCDGNVYDNGCSAQAAGVDEDLSGGCTPPPGMFACGAQFCQLGISYCQIAISDVGGEPNDYRCLPLPVGCAGAPDCACLAAEPCGFMCESDAAGGLTLTCPGG